MTDDRFLNRIRDDARTLRYEASEVTTSRVAARIRARIRERSTPESLLMRWFRPLVTSMTALAIVATLGIAWTGNVAAADEVVEITASAPEVAMAGEIVDVGE